MRKNGEISYPIVRISETCVRIRADLKSDINGRM